MSDKFKKIDDFNIALSNINTLIEFYLQGLSELDNLSQEIIDDYCVRISEKINAKLDEKRTDLISGLTKTYTASLGILQEAIDLGILKKNDDGTFEIVPISDIPLNPEDILAEIANRIPKIIKICNKVINFVAGPYAKVAEFVVEIGKRLPELTTNIEKLVSLKDNIPPIGNYNLNKLNIYVEPILLEDIIGGSQSGDTTTPTEPTEST